MAYESVSYVPNGKGGFARYSYARPSPSSNRFVELGRFFYNLTHGIIQFFNALHYSLTTFNNMISSLPFFIRYFVQAILAFCFPFYSVYRGLMMLINRISGIVYPIYRLAMFVTRLITICVTLPLRIITYIVTQTQELFKNLLKFSIVVAVAVAIVALFLDEEQMHHIKSYVHNATDVFFQQSSAV